MTARGRDELEAEYDRLNKLLREWLDSADMWEGAASRAQGNENERLGRIQFYSDAGSGERQRAENCRSEARQIEAQRKEARERLLAAPCLRH